MHVDRKKSLSVRESVSVFERVREGKSVYI